MAEAVGIRGVRIESPDEVEASIAAALAHTGPVLIDAVVNRTELAMPPSITLEMARGFTLYMVRAIMNGRGRGTHRSGRDESVALSELRRRRTPLMPGAPAAGLAESASCAHCKDSYRCGPSG
jgi:hypothetical protein